MRNADQEKPDNDGIQFSVLIMKPKDLRNYRNLNRVIDTMKKRVVELSERTTRDSVRGSNPSFPYEERTFSVVGTDDAVMYTRQLREAEALLRYYEDCKARIDFFREKVDDPIDKLILEYSLQGKTQQTIGDFVGLEQATVSYRLRKIVNQIDNCIYNSDNCETIE